MARIIVSDNISLDGVMQDPAGDEGFQRGGWVGLIKDRPDLGRFTLDEAMACEAMLMGRRTYEWFAGRWPSRTGPLAERLNSLPKYVCPRPWSSRGPTRAAHGRPLHEVTRLKAALDGDIVVPASVRSSGRCWSTASSTSCDCGSSRSCWVTASACSADERPAAPMRLVDSRTLDGDTASLTYQRI